MEITTFTRVACNSIGKRATASVDGGQRYLKLRSHKLHIVLSYIIYELIWPRVSYEGDLLYNLKGGCHAGTEGWLC